MLLAFVAVAAVSVLVMTAAAFFAVGRGLQVVEAADRQQAADSAAEAAGDAYAQSGGWEGIDLSRAGAVAQAAGARLFVLDAEGRAVGGGGGAGQPGRGPARGAQVGAGVSAPIVVDGEQVGEVRLVFPSRPGTTGRDIAWTWVAIAAVVALVVAAVASWIVTRMLTRPIRTVTAAARRFSSGDRQARAELSGSGEIGELAETFDAMADTVSRSERERQTMTADVAHELRTPLAALQAGLEELRDGLVDPDPDRLARLHDQSLRLGRVVSDLAELSAVESAQATVSQDVDLARVARDEIAGHEPQMRAAGLVVAEQLEESVIVRGDPDRLHQALGNVLANATRYCRTGDRVEVVVRTDGRQAVLEVIDTGPGIPADELAHVFDRLWRGRAARAVTGSGIGLAVTRQVVTAHGGTVEAASVPSGGTTITIRLPRVAGSGD